MYPQTANYQWRQLLRQIHMLGESCSPRGLPSREILGQTSAVSIQHPVVSIPERKISLNFMLTEAFWILTGDDALAPLERYAPSYRRFSDDGVTLNGAYGPRLIPQLLYVADTLVRDPDSRQAVATIWSPNPAPSKDIPCTVSVQWLIRSGQLHCIDTMRSSDVWLGWPYDVFSFSVFTVYLAALLRSRGVQVIPGALVLIAGSQHLYESNAEQAAKIREAETPKHSLSIPSYLLHTSNSNEVIKWLEQHKDSSMPNAAFTLVEA